MLHVAILVHRHDAFNRRDYWLSAIAECWREDGIRVSVINDLRDDIEADLAVLHVDLTRVPQEYLSRARRFAASINGEVSDISKRAISTHLLRRGDAYDGPVIVKTDLNNMGHQEFRLARKGLLSFGHGDAVGNCRYWFKERLGRIGRWRRYGSAEAFRDYPVFDSMSEIPDAVWSDGDLVVERFLPERSNGRYCVRTWLFLGDQDRHGIFYSNDPIIKSHNIVGFERLSEIPEELRQMRHDLRFDFGKFDYTLVGGRPVLFDTNRTPTFGGFPRERYMPVARSLADGIHAIGKHGMPASYAPAID